MTTADELEAVAEMARRQVLAHIVRQAGLWSASLFIGLGLVLVFGGPVRVSGPSYKFVDELGGCYVWGLGFLTLAAMLGVASVFRRRFLVHALRVSAVGFLLFAIACLGAAINSPMAGLTGIITYTWIAALHVWLSTYAKDFR